MTIMTVLGPISMDDLGITLMHEHLIHSVGKVTGNLDEIVHDEVLVADELALYREAGGKSIVDLTINGIGPTYPALYRLALETGLHIVSGTGFYIEDSLSQEICQLDEEALYQWMKRDLIEGFPGTVIRAGIIGEIGCGTLQRSEITPFEERALRAAARVQRETGAAINVHTQVDFGPQGLWVLDILDAMHADLSKVILAHSDARIDQDYYHQILKRGAVIEFSAIGRTQHGSSLGDGTPVPGTKERLEALVQLISDGFQSQILLSHDNCSLRHMRRFGGGGFTNLLQDILTRLLAMGVTEKDLDTVLITNPARMLNLTLI